MLGDQILRKCVCFFGLFFQIATVQGLSGTGSLRLAAALIERYFPGAKVLISSPTWGVCSIFLELIFEIMEKFVFLTAIL